MRCYSKRDVKASGSKLACYKLYDSPGNSSDTSFTIGHASQVNLKDDLNTPPHPPYSRWYGPFTFVSKNNTQGDEHNASGFSSVVHEISDFLVNLDEDDISNKINRLKFSLEKITP